MPTKAPNKTAGKGPKGVQKKITKTNDKKKIATVGKDFTVDEDAVYDGECVHWNKSSGFGFIKLDEEGVVPEDKVMVYWKELQSDDRWPSLYKGVKVKCGLKLEKGKGGMSVKGKNVTGEDGNNLTIQEESEAKREYVGDRNMRFLGNVKFYDFGKGFGYISLQEGYAIDEDVPNELMVQRAEINSGDDAPRLKDKMEVEFGIAKNNKGKYVCYNVTMPGGDAISRDFCEGREEVSKKTFTGEVTFWNWEGYGWIKPDNPNSLPAEVKTLLKEDLEKRKKKAEKKGKDAPTESAIYFRRGDRANFDTKINKGVKVEFKIHKDSQGVGANNVTIK